MSVLPLSLINSLHSSNKLLLIWSLNSFIHVSLKYVPMFMVLLIDLNVHLPVVSQLSVKLSSSGGFDVALQFMAIRGNLLTEASEDESSMDS